jgi:hypothetical protein
MTTERRSLVPLIILSGLIISLCMGLRQSLGLFMRPMGEVGITAAAFGFSIGLSSWALWRSLTGSTLPGWASTVVAISFFNGLILLALIIHGLYLSRMNQQMTRSRVGFTIGELRE